MIRSIPWHVHCNYGILPHFRVLNLYCLQLPPFLWCWRRSRGWSRTCVCLWLCFPGWEEQCRLSTGLPSQLTSLVAQQHLTSTAKDFMEQKPGFNSSSSKLEENLFWSLKCLEKSLCVEFSTISYISISLCLFCTPTSCCALIYFVPQSHHFSLWNVSVYLLFIWK